MTIKKVKWLDSVKPDTLVSKVARTALQERLELVSYYLPLAARKADANIEYVHQLRVSVRRSQAALELFQPLEPMRRSEKLRKRLKKIRRAAGEPRDLDVFIARLTADHEKSDKVAVQTLKRMRAMRKEAQTSLVEIAAWAKGKNLTRKFEQFIPRIRWRDAGPEDTLQTIGPLYLDPVMLQFFYQAEQTLAAPDTLHQLRIQAKRLRYAMELTAVAFDEGFRRDLYPYFETVQDRLGQVNDHATAIVKIAAWAEKIEDPVVVGYLHDVMAQEEKAYSEESESFRQWWTTDLIADLKRRFDHYLRVSID